MHIKNTSRFCCFQQEVPKWFGIFHPKLVVFFVCFSIPKLLQPPRGSTLGRRTPTCNAAPRAFRWSTSTSGQYGDVEVAVDEGAVIVKGSCARWSGCGEECLSAGTWLCHFGKIRHGDMDKMVRRKAHNFADTGSWEGISCS